MILKIRIYPWPHVEQCQEWQASINPPGGRQDLTTDCASDPSEREAPCEREKKRPLHVATKATAPGESGLSSQKS